MRRHQRPRSSCRLFTLVPFFVLLSCSPSACAGALLPNDVPVECAVICGPMAELTMACDASWSSAASSSELRWRAVDEVPRRWLFGSFSHNNVRAVEGSEDEVGVAESGHDLLGRMPAPEPQIIPADLPETVTTTVTVTNRPTPTLDGSAIPTGLKTIDDTTIISIPSPTSGTMTMAMTTTVAMNSEAHTDTSPADTAAQTSLTSATVTTATAAPKMGSSDSVHKKAHEAKTLHCLCSNAGFDVGLVAPLCASCIAKAGDRDSVMNAIVSRCNFTEAEYTPDKDRLVNNVVVRTNGAAVVGREPGIGRVFLVVGASMVALSSYG